MFGDIVAAGEDAGVRIIRADDVFTAGVVIEQVKDEIRNSHVVIAVCTGKNPNVFYEMGIAEHHHKPILVAEGERDLPFDVRHFRAQFYGNAGPGENRSTLRRRVAAAIRQTIGERKVEIEDRLKQVEGRPQPKLDAEVQKTGTGSYLFRILNTGAIPLREIEWEIVGSPRNWRIIRDLLPAYPIEVLEAGDRVSLPLSITMGGSGVVEVVLKGRAPDGEGYERRKLLSPWG